MRVKVLKPFPYAESRATTRLTVEGEILDIADEAVAEGLIGEGLAEAHDDSAAVEIPEDWSTIAKAARFALAAQISGGKVTSEKAAKAIIEAEVAGRAAAAGR